MSMAIKKITYLAPQKQILATPDGAAALGYLHPQASDGNPGCAKKVEGRWIVMEGTIYPSNDANAIGVVLNRYDVTDGDANIAVLYKGQVLLSKLPEAPTEAAKTSLRKRTNILWVPVDEGANTTFDTTAATVAVGEAAGTKYNVPFVVKGALFTDAATTLSNWTIDGESTTKLTVESIEKIDSSTLQFNLNATAATVAGAITVKPNDKVSTFGTVPSAAITIVTVS